jgi:nucleoside-diphosphate-sugar epimerase
MWVFGAGQVGSALAARLAGLGIPVRGVPGTDQTTDRRQPLTRPRSHPGRRVVSRLGCPTGGVVACR